MANLKKTPLAALHTFAKELAKAETAVPGETKFIIIPESALIGQNAEGNLILKGGAHVSDSFKKDDIDAAGYGSDVTDQLGGDPSGADQDPADEAKTHHDNLEKCKGFLQKSYGDSWPSEGDPTQGGDTGANPDEANDMPGKARGGKGNLLKGAVTAGSIQKAIDASNKTLLEAVGAMIEKAVAKSPVAARNEGDGKGDLIVKGANGEEIPVGGVEALKKRVDGLREERKALIAKRDAKIEWTNDERLRAAKISEEIARDEMTLSYVERKSN